MRDESSNSSPAEAGDTAILGADSEDRASDRRTISATSSPVEVPDSQPGLFPDPERRALEPAASPARMDKPTDVRLLEIIQSARNVHIRKSRVWDIHDPEVRSVVKRHLPHICPQWLDTRIEEFQMTVQAHKDKGEPIEEHKELMLQLFDPDYQACGKKRSYTEEGGCSTLHSSKRSSGSVGVHDRSVESIAQREAADAIILEVVAIKDMVKNPLNMHDVTVKLQDIGLTGADLYNAIDLFSEPWNIKRRQVLLSIQGEEEARGYVMRLISPKDSQQDP